MRLAWFSPWTPQCGDAAGRSAVVVPAFAERGFEIDVFVDARRADEPRVFAAREFASRQARAPYDLTVFHLADSAQHDFVWPFLFQWPGLTVLHDGRLYGSRSRALLAAHRVDDYRAEFAWNHPEVSRAASELVINGCEGAFSSQWPMIRTVLAASRLTATHAIGAVGELEATVAGRPVDYIAPGDGRPVMRSLAERADAQARVRAALGLPPAAIVFGVFETLGHEWRLPQILRAFAGAHARTPAARLLLAGPRDRGFDIADLVRTMNLTEATRLVDLSAPNQTGVTLDDAVAATDVTFAMRWPAALDTPGTWLRALAAGRATVILDLAHLATVPALDPRTWQRHVPRDASTASDEQAVTVAIDVMDEDHSVRLALQRLATDTPLRERLGRTGRAYWEAGHSTARMIDDYARTIARAATMPVPAVALPSHLRREPATSAVASRSDARG